MPAMLSLLQNKHGGTEEDTVMSFSVACTVVRIQRHWRGLVAKRKAEASGHWGAAWVLPDGLAWGLYSPQNARGGACGAAALCCAAASHCWPGRAQMCGWAQRAFASSWPRMPKPAARYLAECHCGVLFINPCVPQHGRRATPRQILTTATFPLWTPQAAKEEARAARRAAGLPSEEEPPAPVQAEPVLSEGNVLRRGLHRASVAFLGIRQSVGKRGSRAVGDAAGAAGGPPRPSLAAAALARKSAAAAGGAGGAGVAGAAAAAPRKSLWGGARKSVAISVAAGGAPAPQEAAAPASAAAAPAEQASASGVPPAGPQQHQQQPRMSVWQIQVPVVEEW